MSNYSELDFMNSLDRCKMDCASGIVENICDSSDEDFMDLRDLERTVSLGCTQVIRRLDLSLKRQIESTIQSEMFDSEYEAFRSKRNGRKISI